MINWRKKNKKDYLFDMILSNHHSCHSTKKSEKSETKCYWDFNDFFSNLKLKQLV